MLAEINTKLDHIQIGIITNNINDNELPISKQITPVPLKRIVDVNDNDNTSLEVPSRLYKIICYTFSFGVFCFFCYINGLNNLNNLF